MQQKVLASGAEIVVEEQGSGTPMLMLHGSPDTRAMWLPLMERLAGHAHCYAIDLPGFGDSTLPDDFSLTLDHMADFIRDLLKALNIAEPAILVMTDFGVHYGLAFAVKYPDQVRGLVISNSNFFRDYQWHSFARLYRLPIVGELLMAISSKSLISRTLKNYAPALPDEYIEESYAKGFGSRRVRKTILRMYRERSPNDFAGWDERLVALLKTKPAIVLWGDKDPFITPEFAERYGAKVVQHFPEFSHWLPLEAPTQYAAKIVEWMMAL